MDKNIRIVVLLALFVVFLYDLPESATLCDQTFTVYGKTAGEHPVIMWDVFVGGECWYWRSYALFPGHDRPVVMESRHDGGGAKWMDEFLGDLQTEEYVVIPDSNGRLYISDTIYAAVPAVDTSYDGLWRAVHPDGAYDTERWERYCRHEPSVECMDNPEFRGTDAEFVYRYAGGLYKNYGFKEAIYFPTSKYLIIMTHQPMTLIGLDRMDGLLIYKLINGGPDSR